jgi:CHASE3 domain sensor protein
MKTEREPLEFAVKRRDLEKQINTFQLDRKGLDQKLAELSKIYVGDPNFDSMKQYLISYAQRRGQETVEEMNMRHQREIEQENPSSSTSKKKSFLSKFRSGDEYSDIGYMTGGGVVNPRETHDQMATRHGWERFIQTNKTRPVEFILDEYSKLIAEEPNAQKRSYLINIQKYFAKNFQNIRNMTEKELLQRQQIDREMQKSNTPWIKSTKSEKDLQREEEEAMARGEYDRVVLGANLRDGSKLFNEYETDAQQEVRQVLEKRILNGEFRALEDLKTVIVTETDGLFKSLVTRSKFMQDLVSFYNARRGKFNEMELEDRHRSERFANEGLKQKSLVAQQLTLFMY